MEVIKAASITIFLAAITAAITYGRSETFTGVWVLDAAASEFGICPKPEADVLEINETPGRISVIEMLRDESGSQVVKHNFRILRRHGRAIALRRVGPPDKTAALIEHWTRARGGKVLIIRKVSCDGPSEHLVFRRSADLLDR